MTSSKTRKKPKAMDRDLALQMFREAAETMEYPTHDLSIFYGSSAEDLEQLKELDASYLQDLLSELAEPGVGEDIELVRQIQTVIFDNLPKSFLRIPPGKATFGAKVRDSEIAQQALTFLHDIGIIYRIDRRLKYRPADGELLPVDEVCAKDLINAFFKIVEVHDHGPDEPYSLLEVRPPKDIIDAFISGGSKGTTTFCLPNCTAVTPVPFVTFEGVPVLTNKESRNHACFLTKEYPSWEEEDLGSVEDAYRLLKSMWFGRTPYVDEVRGWTTTLAALLTLVQRPLLPRSPGFAVSADRQGTGKTTHAQSIAILAEEGYRLADLTVPRGTSGGLGDTITHALFNRPPYLLLDNLVGRVEDSHLAKAMTSPDMRVNLKFENGSSSISTKTLFLLTMNDAQFGKDLATRFLVIDLSLGDKTLYEYYGDSDIIKDVMTHKEDLLKALLCVLSAGIQSGDCERDKGSRFPEWDRTVGNTVMYLQREVDPEGLSNPFDLYLDTISRFGDSYEEATIIDSLATIGLRLDRFSAKDVREAIERVKDKKFSPADGKLIDSKAVMDLTSAMTDIGYSTTSTRAIGICLSTLSGRKGTKYSLIQHSKSENSKTSRTYRLEEITHG